MTRRTILKAQTELVKGKRDEAFNEFEAVISLLESHPEERKGWTYVLGTMYGHIGNIYLSRDQKDQAVKAFQDGLSRILEDGTEQEENSISSLHAICLGLIRTEQLEDALTVAQKIYNLDIKYNSDGDDMPVRSLLLLQEVYFLQKNYTKSLEFSKKAIENMEQNPSTSLKEMANASIMTTLAYLNSNNLKDARIYFEKTVKHIEAGYGLRGMDMADFYHDFAEQLEELDHSNQENMNRAKDLYTKANQIYVELNDIGLQVSTLFPLGSIAVNQGDHIKSIGIFTELLEKADQVEEIPSKMLEMSHAFLGRSYRAMHKHELSIQHHLKALELYEEADTKSELLYNHYFGLGKAYEELGNYRDAEKAFRKMLDAGIAQLGKDDPKVVELAQVLINILREQGKTVEANKLGVLYDLDSDFI